MTMLMNLTEYGIHPGIIDVNGSKDAINLMPHGRAHLIAGWSLDPDWNARNAGQVKAVSDDTLQAEKARVERIKQSMQTTPSEVAPAVTPSA